MFLLNVYKLATTSAASSPKMDLYPRELLVSHCISANGQNAAVFEHADPVRRCFDEQFAELPGRLTRRREVGPFTLSEMVCPSEVVLCKHAHRHAYVTFVIEGSFHEEYSTGEAITYRAGALRLMPAAEMHESGIQAGTRCLHIGSDPARLDHLHQRPAMPSKPVEVNSLAATWLAHRLYAEFSREDAASAMALEGLILETLAEIARSEMQENRDGAPQWLRRATEIVETRFLQRLCLNEIASEVGVHYVHLSRQFHKYNRCTVGELIRRRRVQHACQLLAYSRTPLAEIALTCGFSDQSHLSFLFKRYMGLSPSKFRSLASVNTAGTEQGASEITATRQVHGRSLPD